MSAYDTLEASIGAINRKLAAGKRQIAALQSEQALMDRKRASLASAVDSAKAALAADSDSPDLIEALGWAESALVDFSAANSPASSLTVTLVSVSGLPASAAPAVTLSCSSPVEDHDLTVDAPVVVSQPDVESCMLSFSAKDVDIPLGASAALSLEPLAQVGDKDMSVQADCEVVREEEVAIVAEGEAAEGEGGTLLTPTCTLTVKFVYKMGLAERTNKVVAEINQAQEERQKIIEEMRKVAASQVAPRESKQQAVSQGFLNNSGSPKAAKKASMMTRSYNFFAAPDSFFMTFVPKYKNIAIFMVGVGVMHVFGDELALAAPF
jgi:hypothetical protein